MIARALVLAGSAATILSAFVTWVTVTGHRDPRPRPDQGRRRHRQPHSAGIDTALWPALLAVGVVAAILALLGVGRILLIGLGLLTALAGGLLLVYMANVIELETRDGAQIPRGAARALLDRTVGPGTPLLLAGGVLMLLGGLAQQHARR